MDKLQEIIDIQIEFNKGKNLFFSEWDNTFKFIQETVNAIENIGDINEDYASLLIDYATNKALYEFCRINQYFTFNKQTKKDLRNIYVDLFSSIRKNNNSIEAISKAHYQNLKQWLQNTNPFAEKIYSLKNKILQPITCSEYSAELQIEILQINISQLMEPVLDIGCGKQGKLVNYLSKNGIEAFGFDRFSFKISNLMEADWFEFEYGISKWGTIISNLGFSNHFNHHHLRKDGSFIEYAKKYMDILNSLKIGGYFHYAPDLPFIEQYLDNHKFQLERQNIGKFDFKTTVIKRLR